MTTRVSLIKSLALLSVSTAAFAALGACAPTMTHHGYLAYDARPSTDIKVGDTEATVLDKLGQPSQKGTYDPTEWYYIDQVSMKMTYKKPRVTQRSVTIIDFDKGAKTVSAVQTLSLADGRDLTPNPNQTPTRGRSLSAIEQLLGTVGHQQLTHDQDSDPGNQHRHE